MKLGAAKDEGAFTLEDLEGYTGGLVALVGRAALMGGRYGVGGLLDRLVGLFGRSNVYVELQRHLLRDEATDNQALVTLASAFHVPSVATNGVRFAAAADRPSTMSSRASVTRPRSIAPAGVWSATPSDI